MDIIIDLLIWMSIVNSFPIDIIIYENRFMNNEFFLLNTRRMPKTGDVEPFSQIIDYYSLMIFSEIVGWSEFYECRPV